MSRSAQATPGAAEEASPPIGFDPARGTVWEAEIALQKCRERFAEYVAHHRAKLLPQRTPDVFYQNARTAHNAEVEDKIERNQHMVDLCDAALHAIATEAHRAATVEQGAVHEGAGPKDIAQGPSQ